MKYVIAMNYRLNGSGAENEADLRRMLDLYSKWTPAAGATFHQFVTRLDGGGGFSVVETDNPADLIEATSKFGPFVDYQIYPVVDVAEGVRAAQEGVEFRESVS